MKTYYPIQKLVNKLSITICSVIHSISSVLNGIVVLKPFSFNTQPNKTIYSPKTKWLLQKFLFWEPLLETPRAVNMVFLPRKKKKTTLWYSLERWSTCGAWQSKFCSLCEGRSIQRHWNALPCRLSHAGIKDLANNCERIFTDAGTVPLHLSQRRELPPLWEIYKIKWRKQNNCLYSFLVYGYTLAFQETHPCAWFNSRGKEKNKGSLRIIWKSDIHSLLA